MTPDYAGAVTALRQAQRVLLIGHVAPDPDALGSAIAVGLALESLGKQVQVSVGQPGFAPPLWLQALPGLHLVCPPEEVSVPDVAISCDAATIERLGTLAEAMQAADVSIAMDHHGSFTGFGDIHLVDFRAAATAEIALQLIERLGVALTADIAAAIYSGLATDTGSFKYQGTSAETLRIAARLFETGFDHAAIARAMFDAEPFSALQMLGKVLNEAVLLPDELRGLGVVHASVTRAHRGDLDEDFMERVIETVRRTSEAEVALVLKQGDDDYWKASLRSKSLVDVASVASALGGGGHRYAAGCTLSKDHDESLTAVLTELRKVVGDA